MATLPAARGQGAATTVMAALAGWAAGVGAGRALLQVEEQSTAARRIYAALGFLPVYRYTYRRKPLTSPARIAAGGVG
jgi:GNAT superfamily N-acetyltransferase